jgi:stress response protein SCP2
MSETVKKPKCYGCGKVGEDNYYVFFREKRGKDGHLWHLSCASEVRKIIDSNKANK